MKQLEISPRAYQISSLEAIEDGGPWDHNRR